MSALKNALSPRRLWKAWPFSLKVLLTAGTVFLIASLGTAWTGDRNNFPEWLEAVATAAAFIAAMFAARYAARAFRMELKRDDRRAEEQRRTQAEVVAAWFESQRRPIIARSHDGSEHQMGTERVHGVHVRNASNVPVTQAWVDLTVETVGANGEKIRDRVGRHDIGLVPPSDQPMYELVSEPLAEALDAYGRGPDRKRVEGVVVLIDLYFTDAGGRTWIRTHQGDLIER